MKNLFIRSFTVFVLSIASIALSAQVVQTGLRLSVNNTFFHRGDSRYKAENHYTAIAPGAGAGITALVHFSERFHLMTGFNYHLKQYTAYIGNFDVEGLSGHFYADARYNSFELPLLFGFNSGKEKTYRFIYRAGIVPVHYRPSREGIGYSLEGSVPGDFGITSTASDFSPTFASDLLVSVALARFVNNRPRHEFSLSYQYGVQPVSPVSVRAWIATANAIRIYDNVYRPNLSTFMLNYTFFPRWKKDEMQTESPAKEFVSPL